MRKHSSSAEKHAKYFEAIIQLRPADQKLVSYVYKMIEARPDVFISDQKKVKTGIDIYLSSWRVAMAIGKRLTKTFSGNVKISRSLHTRSHMTSKDIYRVTVLFRLKNEDL